MEKTKNNKERNLEMKGLLKKIDINFDKVVESQNLKAVDMLKFLICARRDYLLATKGLNYNNIKDNEQLIIRRVNLLEKLYLNLQQISFLEARDKKELDSFDSFKKY